MGHKEGEAGRDWPWRGQMPHIMNYLVNLYKQLLQLSMIGYNLGTGRPRIIQMVDCSNTRASLGSTYIALHSNIHLHLYIGLLRLFWLFPSRHDRSNDDYRFGAIFRQYHSVRSKCVSWYFADRRARVLSLLAQSLSPPLTCLLRRKSIDGERMEGYRKIFPNCWYLARERSIRRHQVQAQPIGLIAGVPNQVWNRPGQEREH